jgi:cation transport ATPase
MHPEVVEDQPGDCPKCGMPLEPVLSGESDDDEEAAELRKLSRKFWIAFAMAMPVLLIAMSGMIPGWHGLGFPPRSISKWIEFALATPVVLWAGSSFFVKAWRSLVHRSPNMFTLIATGVGAAYLFSAVAVLAPGLFPESFRSHCDGSTWEIGLYFESAAVITVLVLIGQLLEARARSQTGQAVQALLSPAAKARRHRGGLLCSGSGPQCDHHLRRLGGFGAGTGHGLRSRERSCSAHHCLSLFSGPCYADVHHGRSRTRGSVGNSHQERRGNRGDLNGIVSAVHVGRSVMRNIRQNLVFAFAYNAIGIPVAAGVLYPVF